MNNNNKFTYYKVSFARHDFNNNIIHDERKFYFREEAMSLAFKSEIKTGETAFVHEVTEESKLIK